MSKYSQGVCEDGAAILCDGERITVDEVVSRLNSAAELEADAKEYERDAIRMLDVTADWASAFCAVRDKAVAKHHKATELVDELKDENVRLRSAIADHNAGLDMLCVQRKGLGRCDDYNIRNRDCPDCPRDNRVDIQESGRYE